MVKRRQTFLALGTSFSVIRHLTEATTYGSVLLPGAHEPAQDMIPEEHPSSETKDSDDLLRLLGNPGRFQIIQYLVLCLQFLSYVSEFVMVFFALAPTGILVDPLTLFNSSLFAHEADNQSMMVDYGNVSYLWIPFKYVRSLQACDDTGFNYHNASMSIIYLFADLHQRSIISDVRYDVY